MAPKGSKHSGKAAKATDAVRTVTAGAGKDFVDTWMKDHPDKVAELALYLMSGGLLSSATKKSLGEMSRGTLHLSDLPRKWMSEFLLKLEPDIPQDIMGKVYEHCPGVLLQLFRLSQCIPPDPMNRPIKISKFFPRNYIGLEHTAKLRYCFFGQRLKTFAAIVGRERGQWSSDGRVKAYLQQFCWDRVGVFSLGPKAVEDGEELDGAMVLVHPSGFKVELDARMGVDSLATITDNMDEASAVLRNSDGMSVRLLPWLLKKGYSEKQPEMDFLSQGLVHAKSQGAALPLENDTAGGASADAAASSGAAVAASMPALVAPPAALALEDAQTPPPKRQRTKGPCASVSSSIGAASSGTVDF